VLSEKVVKIIDNKNVKSDGSLFLISLVPLKLVGTNENNENVFLGK
jgi:hypothetical protein